jgi:phenylpyruvate tautomerase PptA (4-oxalocrotonate tautomerase family)
MPLLRITTNQEVAADKQQEISRQLSAFVAEMLGKPESYVMVVLQVNPAMSFAGSHEPLAYIELKSLGLPEDKTTDFSASLCQHVNQLLNILPKRTYIEFSSPARHFWGWNSATF